MRKLGFLTFIFVMVNTCVELAVAFFVTVVNPTDTVGTMLLWQIPAVSFLCTLGSLIYPWDRDMKKREMGIRILIHYLYVNGVVLGAGFVFRWFQFTHLVSVVSMLLTIALIYALVSVISWTRSARFAKRMNEKLEEYQREKCD